MLHKIKLTTIFNPPFSIFRLIYYRKFVIKNRGYLKGSFTNNLFIFGSDLLPALRMSFLVTSLCRQSRSLGQIYQKTSLVIPFVSIQKVYTKFIGFYTLLDWKMYVQVHLSSLDPKKMIPKWRWKGNTRVAKPLSLYRFFIICSCYCIEPSLKFEVSAIYFHVSKMSAKMSQVLTLKNNWQVLLSIWQFPQTQAPSLIY